jgi:hypothetical protein
MMTLISRPAPHHPLTQVVLTGLVFRPFTQGGSDRLSKIGSPVKQAFG